MSPVLLLLVAVAVVVILGLALRMLGERMRKIAALLIVGVIVGGTMWVLIDAYVLQQHLYGDEKLFALDIDGKLVAAFALASGGKPDVIDNLAEMRAAYPDLAYVKDDYYKVIVLTWPVVADGIEREGFRASAGEIRAALLSGHPRQLFIDKAVAEYGPQALGQARMQADSIYPNEDGFASTLFAILAERPLSDPMLLFRGFREGTVLVYPETVTFKILKLLPEGSEALLLPRPS